jgi:lactate dehydrogenase-like 2-hydroxyacid dehydrogenase
MLHECARSEEIQAWLCGDEVHGREIARRELDRANGANIGSATIETRTAMGMLALDNVEAVLNGGPAPTLV